MYMENGKATDVQIAYIGGGSRGWAWGLMQDLALDGEMSGTVRLYDIDYEAACVNRIIGVRYSSHPMAKSCWKYQVFRSLKEVLTGADFVVISILPGTFQEMYSDVHAPEKYGIWQPVGDTVGPGGLMRTLRTVPMFVEIAEAIREYAPEAWVINYTNPMSVCVRTLYKVFPKIKAFGCCHEVFGTQELLAAMIQERFGEKPERKDIHINVMGINHFTWLNRASWKTSDLIPLYREFAQKYYEEGFCEDKKNHWMNNSFASANRVKFDLFLKYELIAAAGDRHLAEFVAPDYTSSPEEVRNWRFGLTAVEWRMKDLKERLAKKERLLDQSSLPELKRSGEEGHLLIKALIGLGEMVSNVNIPNRGQIPNLPLGAVVETNALFRHNEVSPVLAGEIPGPVQSLVMHHILNQENSVQAAMECDKEKAYAVFVNDPQMVRAHGHERELFEEMLEVQRGFLPEGW